MVDHGKNLAAHTVDQAINQILGAEREARERVAKCQAEAARIQAAAEERARAVADRTEQRIQETRRIADRAVERALAGLRERASRQRDQAQDAPDGERLDRALDALVDEIIGAGA